ncbi:hypothetical protein SDC9_133136 [bioreactor metagenome]|uniref:Uncharacterized protein n=1 Tax=bioreactor metagenome TaxID=1076179 RepID=A0A645DAU7_9ZZZZ
MGEQVDAFQAGIVFRIELLGVPPFHELLHYPGKGEGALVGRLLVVPVILDDAEVGVARPDQRQNQDFPRFFLVAQLLQFLGCREDVLGQVGEAVDIHQHLPYLRRLQRLEEVHAADFFVLALLVPDAAEEAAARRVVLQVEDEILVQLGFRVDRRHAAGDEQHEAPPVGVDVAPQRAIAVKLSSSMEYVNRFVCCQCRQKCCLPGAARGGSEAPDQQLSPVEFAVADRLESMVPEAPGFGG